MRIVGMMLLGAVLSCGAVEAPPDDMKPTCETQSRGQWTWAPNCDPAIEGM
jgi:hypothetical protein